MLRRNSAGSRYALTPAQLAVVAAAEERLPTEDLRHSFRLHVSAKLTLAAPIGGVCDQLLHACIDATLGSWRSRHERQNCIVPTFSSYRKRPRNCRNCRRGSEGFFSRTAERPHLRSGCVEPLPTGTTLCITSTRFAGAGRVPPRVAQIVQLGK